MTIHSHTNPLIRVLLLFALLLTMHATVAQTINRRQAKPSSSIIIPFEASRFNTAHQKAEFLMYKGRQAMKILPGNKQVILKGITFTNGTIEFDTQPVDPAKPAFISCYFREQDTVENECVYLRTKPDEQEQRNDAVQYAPTVHGVNLWDLLGHYQAPAIIHNTD